MSSYTSTEGDGKQPPIVSTSLSQRANRFSVPCGRPNHQGFWHSIH